MLIETFTETEFRILEALAVYRFLTAEQLMRLGVTRAKRHLYATLARISRRSGSAVGSLDFGVVPGRGRLAKLYYLTPQGADIVTEACRSIREIYVPERVRLFNRDYFHRINCIDFQIALRTWAQEAGVLIDFLHTYYDGQRPPEGKRGFYPKTRIVLSDKVLVPDAVFSFTTPSKMTRLCAFEMHNGRETAHVERQLLTYVQAIHEQAIHKAYDYEHGIRVLSVFDSEKGRELVAERMRRHPEFEEVSQLFFAKTLTQVQETFVDGWKRFHTDENVRLF